MPTFWPVFRTAAKFAPVALQVGRQVDRQLRPHVFAYRAARDVDGYVGRWTSQDDTHWAVFAGHDDTEPLKVFPPVTGAEAATIGRQIDRVSLRHHSELPEARARDAGRRVTGAPRRLASRRRSGPDEPASSDEL